jgi:hypothetical protein
MLRVWRAVLVIEYGKRASAGSRTRLERAKSCNIKMDKFRLCRFLIKCKKSGLTKNLDLHNAGEQEEGGMRWLGLTRKGN